MADQTWIGDRGGAHLPKVDLEPQRYTGEPRRVAFLGRVASGLLLVSVVVLVAMVATLWELLGTADGLQSGQLDPAQAYSDTLASIELFEDLEPVYLISVGIAAVVFVRWLWLARLNAEWLSEGVHARRRGWVIGGWLVPIVDLFFPYQVVRDVWRGSNPSTRDTRGELSRVSGGVIVAAWWICYLSSFVINGVVEYQLDDLASADAVDELRTPVIWAHCSW